MKHTHFSSKQVLLHSYQIFAGIFSAFVAAILCFALFLSSRLPDRYYMAKGSEFSIGSNKMIQTKSAASSYPLSVYSSAGNTFPMSLKLFGAVEIKEVSVQVVDRRVVSLCGTPFGIKMVTDGIMVIGTGGVSDLQNQIQNPAKQAGIQEGDVILSLNGEKLSSKKQLNQVIKNCGGKPISMTVRRENDVKTVEVSPVKSFSDNSYHVGLWVRDSSAGIGTMTFYDPQSRCFAGLGHAICDIDTGQIMPLSQGEIVKASIIGVEQGKSGTPGQLLGSFVTDQPVGTLYSNSCDGVYGKLSSPPPYSQTIPLAQSHEIQEGAVKILATVQGEKPRLFDAQIEKVSLSQNEPTKNMVIHITDPELLQTAGGIVQGMSGSPIIQNGMLVGAVTHVFVNDPTRGYGIFAENMDNTLLNLSAKCADTYAEAA